MMIHKGGAMEMIPAARPGGARADDILSPEALRRLEESLVRGPRTLLRSRERRHALMLHRTTEVVPVEEVTEIPHSGTGEEIVNDEGNQDVE